MGGRHPGLVEEGLGTKGRNIGWVYARPLYICSDPTCGAISLIYALFLLQEIRRSSEIASVVVDSARRKGKIYPSINTMIIMAFVNKYEN